MTYLFFFVLDEEEKEKITKYTYYSFLGGGGDCGLLTQLGVCGFADSFQAAIAPA